MFEFELPEKFRRYVPPAVWAILVAVLLAIPLKVISYGYLPGDDALRHCAKAVSGKPWSEILVLGNPHAMSSEFGWQALLGAVHHATHWSAEALVIFSVVLLFFVPNAALWPWLRRPEAWLAGLLAAMIVSDVPQRFLLGRPFVITIAALMVILFVPQKSRPDLKKFLLFTGLIGAGVFFHGVWYLWLLPVAAFFFAGQFQWTLLVAGAWLAGTALAALLTGHPVEYLSQALNMALHAVGKHTTSVTEVSELQPFGGDMLAIIVIGALVALRWAAKPNAVPFARNPAFWLMCGCWMLGFRVSRFWDDWGWPALMVLIATEVEFLLLAKFAADSWRRLLLTTILAAAAFLAVTSDLNSRYTKSLTWQFLSEAEHPELNGWMPDKGGIVYSAYMETFYQTFYKNPKADWRYILGFEPTLMPADDFQTYHNILWNYGDARTYAPWVKKMKPADRLVIHGNGNERPNIPQLEWYYGVSGIWIGRTPRTNDGPFQLQSLH
jgi:hypothetical protein